MDDTKYAFLKPENYKILPRNKNIALIRINYVKLT